jgi:flagellar biosynthesis/type III secretory pathway protein FliH
MSSPRRLLVGRPSGTPRSLPAPPTPTPSPTVPRAVPPTPPGDGDPPHRAPGSATRRRSDAELRAERIAAARGYADGLARGQADLAAAVAAAGNLAAELERLAPREAGRAAAAIVRLALVIAERIMGQAIALDPGRLVEVVERAAATINGSPTARVILNPTARPIVEAAWVARHGTAYLGKRWSFEADPSLPAGGCRLVYEHGFVDASLDVQLEEIGRAVEHALPILLREVGHLGGDGALRPGPADASADTGADTAADPTLPIPEPGEAGADR